MTPATMWAVDPSILRRQLDTLGPLERILLDYRGFDAGREVLIGFR